MGPRSDLKRVVAASMACTVAEWYEFFLYGTATALVFAKVFFPQTGSDFDAILAAFITYAIGFVARPLGGVVFGHFGDKYGRKTEAAARSAHAAAGNAGLTYTHAH